MSARESLRALAWQPGAIGLLALAMLLSTAWFYAAKVKPMEARRLQLDEQLERRTRAAAPGKLRVRASTPGAKLAAFYEFFDREETVTDWLARLYAIGKGVGVELQSAEYRFTPQPGLLDRYQITLPIKGTSAQIRAFADNALGAVSVLSLDQVVFRRKRISDITVEADITLSLYLLRR